MWTCPKCGEKIEDQFDSCWKCAAQPEQAAPPPLVSRRGRYFFLLGIVFELVLILLNFVLPDCWLSVEVYNFTIVTHFPLFMVMEGLRFGGSAPTAILGLLIALAAMGSVWGFLIYLVTRLIKGLLSRFVVSQRQRLVLRYGVGLLGVVVLFWTVVADLPAMPIPFAASPEVKSTVNGNTAFALDLYHKLKDRPGNLFFSPYSISTSLAMTYAGAQGQTETEMAKVLHFNLAQTNLPVAFSALGARMHQIQRWNRITLTTANSLWCQKDYHFTDAFLNLVHDYYHGEARRVDFKRSPQASADEINGWVERQTKRKIKAAVTPSQFTDLTKLVLCNAIYFKGKWQHQFKASKTKPAPFYVTTNEIVTVPMMYQESHFKTARSDDRAVELLELPYSGKDLSMVILLPQVEYPLPDVEQPGLPDLEQKLTADNLRIWLAKLDQESADKTWVALPRFTTTQSFDLAKELKSLGMITAFGENAANFSGMDGTTNLLISDVLHKAFVEVNESGTEAAAMSLTMVRSASMSGRFIVDHPFIFLIRENGSGSILFIGRIVDPTK
jgi:serine protease inhibitor